MEQQTDNAPNAALARVKTALRTHVAIAAAIGITQQSVSEIYRRGIRAPIKWCQPLDRATAALGDRVSCHELRPDFFPADFVPQAPEVEEASSAHPPRSSPDDRLRA